MKKLLLTTAIALAMSASAFAGPTVPVQINLDYSLATTSTSNVNTLDIEAQATSYVSGSTSAAAQTGGGGQALVQSSFSGSNSSFADDSSGSSLTIVKTSSEFNKDSSFQNDVNTDISIKEHGKDGGSFTDKSTDNSSGWTNDNGSSSSFTLLKTNYDNDIAISSTTIGQGSQVLLAGNAIGIASTTGLGGGSALTDYAAYSDIETSSLEKTFSLDITPVFPPKKGHDHEE